MRGDQFGVAVVMSGFPRRSETFALGELMALDKRGALAAIFATKAGDGTSLPPGCERLLDRLFVLDAASEQDQGEAVAQMSAGMRIHGVHGYFAHQPAAVAAAAARRLGARYGFSVHARDARKVTPAVLERRVRAAACVTACNADVATAVEVRGGNVQLIPHGVDLAKFRATRPSRDDSLRILAVGRLVEKKGFDVLVEAVGMLRQPFHLQIVGDGPQRRRLAAMIALGGLTDRVTLCGSVPHDELPAYYEAASVVAVPSVVDRSGDRDGVPNVLLEAMSCERPVVACDAGAISTAVAHGDTGLLIPSGNAEALAAALERLAEDPGLRARLARRARARVQEQFELDACANRFCQVLEAAYA